MTRDISQYYDQIKDHYLETVEDGERIKAFYLRKDQGRMMSVLLIFSPEGIIITGDLNPDPRGKGVIARGHTLTWLFGSLEPRYMASKFLEKKWSPLLLKESIEEYIKEFPEQEREERCDWKIGPYTKEQWTETEALKFYISKDELIESYEEAEHYLPRYKSFDRWLCPYDPDFLVDGGYGYDPAEVGWLAAIQKRFRELFDEAKK